MFDCSSMASLSSLEVSANEYKNYEMEFTKLYVLRKSKFLRQEQINTIENICSKMDPILKRDIKHQVVTFFDQSFFKFFSFMLYC